MSENGWIKIYRDLLEKPIWLKSTPQQQSVLIAILLSANHNPKTWEWNGKQYDLKAGQFITSASKLMKKAGQFITRQNVRSALNRFEKLNFLTIEATKESTLISVINWEAYQADQPSAQPSTQPRPNQGPTTNKNVRKKEVTKECTIVHLSGEVSQDVSNVQNCPQQKIIDLYHQLLPELPKIRVWNETSKSNLRARWKSVPEFQSLDWWRGFFTNIKQSNFLMGRVGNFQADLGWIVKAANFQKIMNNKYVNRGPNTGSSLGDSNARACQEFIGEDY